jgi:hypothetical protein
VSLEFFRFSGGVFFFREYVPLQRCGSEMKSEDEGLLFVGIFNQQRKYTNLCNIFIVQWSSLS